MAGKNGYVICDGECEGISEGAARAVFKNAKPFVPYVHPHSSRNLNFHHNVTAAFNVMTDFLDANLEWAMLCGEAEHELASYVEYLPGSESVAARIIKSGTCMTDCSTK